MLLCLTNCSFIVVISLLQVFLFLPLTKEEVNAFVCLSVSKITQKRVHGFG